MKKNNNLLVVALLVVVAHAQLVASDKRALLGATAAGAALATGTRLLVEHFQSPTPARDVAYLYSRLQPSQQIIVHGGIVGFAPNTPKSRAASLRLQAVTVNPVVKDEAKTGSLLTGSGVGLGNASSSSSSSSTSPRHSSVLPVPLGGTITVTPEPQPAADVVDGKAS